MALTPNGLPVVPLLANSNTSLTINASSLFMTNFFLLFCYQGM